MDLSLPGAGQHGQVSDVLLSARRDLAATQRFFTRALRAGTIPAEVATDRAAVCPRVPGELIPLVLHTVEQYANNPIEADHGRLKARLWLMRGLKRHRSARILAAGHAFVQNLRRGLYRSRTRCRLRELQFGRLCELRQDRGSCLSVCCT